MSQLIFCVILAAVSYLAYKWYGRIVQNIMLGKPIRNSHEDRIERWRRVLLIAFGQKKMFDRPLVGCLHLFIYVAFLFTQIELLEIVVDGISGRHRAFSSSLGSFYTLLINTIEVLSLLALIGTVVFIIRRVVLRISRFRSAEMKGWPSQDALYILLGEIVLVISIFLMNGADGVLQSLEAVHYPKTGELVLSSYFFPQEGWASRDISKLVFIERIGWWMHVMVVFGFVLYLPHSKHLHIFFAFFNVYHARLTEKGKMSNMPAVQKEVTSMMGLSQDNPEEQMDYEEDIPDFGAKDVTGLSRRDILGAYSCTECGRCTSVCPAHITGKKLSPRKIMMDVRDRADELGKHLDQHPDQHEDGKSLFDYVSKEELHACTSCNACVEACPVLINPLDIILEMRRYEILTEGTGPQEWLPMFNSLESSGSVWQMSVDREAWIEDKN